MVKIGWLYLNKGRWGQQQIVPAEWVEASTRGHIEANPGDQYGYHWWVNNDGNYADGPNFQNLGLSILRGVKN
jgi:CubicO group peptidase (beta-lactamase class C family)